MEAKGLTAPEIEDALRQVNPNKSIQTYRPSYQASYPSAYGSAPYAIASNQWDWRDYFVSLTYFHTVLAVHIFTIDNNCSSRYCSIWRRFLVSSKVHFEPAAVRPTKNVVQKYLLPNLRPPAASAYEEDRDALTAQFDAAETLLKEIQAETAAVRNAVEEQKERVEKTTEEVESMVREMREGEIKTRDEMREIREEVDNIREMLPKVRFRHFLVVHQIHHSIQIGRAHV